RYDPARGYERPGSGEMGEILDAKLKQPPAGVQIWSSCMAQQQAYEFDSGSLFLEALCDAMINLKRIQEPDDSLPLDALESRVLAYPQDLQAKNKLKKNQRAPRAGREPAGGPAYARGAKMPDRVAISPPPVRGGIVAAPAVVNHTPDELTLIPP